LLGWKAYFRLADTPGVFHDLDQWIARRLRMVQLKQWKRGSTVYRELRRRDVPERVARAAAAHAKRWWRIAGHGARNTAMPTKYREGMGLPRLAPH
jgi:RNA-directed DNA polymerase